MSRGFWEPKENTYRELTKGEHNSPKSAPHPSTSPRKRKHASCCHADQVARFPRTWGYHPNSAVTARFVSKREGRFLFMASGSRRRLSRNRTNLRAAVAQHFVGIARGLAVPGIVV